MVRKADDSITISSLTLSEPTEPIVCNTEGQTPTSGVPGFAGSFLVRRGFEGKQIIIEWDVPNSPSLETIRLVRKKFSYPRNIDDGVNVFEDDIPTVKYYIDEDIEEKEVYYYKLFLLNSSGIWNSSRKLQGYAFSCITGFYQEKLFQLLPTIYRREDSNTRQVIFGKKLETELKEYVHINDDGESQLGQLRRFLALFGVFWDEAKCLIDFMPELWDVDRAPADFLQYIAPIVDVVFNFDIPVDRQRVEIREAVAGYKLKGTKRGISAHTQKITSFDNEVDEFVDNVLLSNRENRTSYKFNDAESEWVEGTCGDETYRSLDISGSGLYSFDRILICVNVPSNQELESNIVKKLIRTLRDWIPADAVAIVIFSDKAENEILSSPEFIKENSNDEEELRFILYANDESLISNQENIISESIN